MYAMPCILHGSSCWPLVRTLSLFTSVCFSVILPRCHPILKLTRGNKKNFDQRLNCCLQHPPNHPAERACISHPIRTATLLAHDLRKSHSLRGWAGIFSFSFLLLCPLPPATGLWITKMGVATGGGRGCVRGGLVVA